MNDIEQSNKKHVISKSGRKARENNKIKLTDSNKVDYQDSRGQSFVKKKKHVDKINSKAFAIQNINKAKKKVSLVVDRQISKHTFHSLSEQYLWAPQLIALVGPQNSGKSSLLRTLMRHYTGHRVTITGPVTVVTSKKKKVTFFECPNDLHSQIDIAKTADMILLMINVKEGLQTETFEFLELLLPHGIPRIMIIFTHIDECKKNGKEAHSKMKLITKRIQTEVHALPFRLTDIKQFRTAGNSEYKREEVMNLARLIGEKNPLPNEWKENHPFILVDRLEKVQKENLNDNSEFESIKFFGYVRGCAMSADIPRMHLMGVDDLVVENVEPLNEPCPTPLQESLVPKKRKPLEVKERKAYAPMCGYGGVLKDSDGFHIMSMDLVAERKMKKKSEKMSDNDSDDDDDDEREFVKIKSGLIREESDESDEESVGCDRNGAGRKRLFSDDSQNESESKLKKRCVELDKEKTNNLISGFEDLQDEFKTENNRINYERLVYDEDYLSDLSNIVPEQKELSKDLFVTGTWNENEDAATLLKKDDINRKKNNKKHKKESEDEENLDSDDEKEIKKMDLDDNDMKDDEGNEYDEENYYDGEEVDDVNSDEEEVDDDHYDDEVNSDDVDEDEVNSDDVDEDEVNSDDVDEDEVNGDDDDDDDKEDNKDNEEEDDDGMNEFQKRKNERQKKTKREKKLEKKAKHKALFDKLYDQKQGDSGTKSYFDSWKEANKEQEEKNKVAFEHLDKDGAYKITGLMPGTYVSVLIKKVPKSFFQNLNPKRPIILGGLTTGEDTYAMLTASFRLSRHYDAKQVLKSEDPICMSIGWRRIQSFSYFFKEEHNLRKTYLKYSEKKGLFCKVAFLAPVVPVKTGLSAFINFEHHDKFRLVGLGSILSKDDTVDIKKKLKRIGEPVKIFNKTAFIKGMFSSDLEVMEYSHSLLKTTSGIRGSVKKALRDDMFGPGSFRATFEAKIFLSDIVSLTCWVTIPMIKCCVIVQNLLVKPGEVYPYLKLWNDYYRDNNIPLPQQNQDSKYQKIERKPFNHAPITFSKKDIERLPFKNRPIEDTPEDKFQKSRPKVVLDSKESQKAQMVNLLHHAIEDRQQKLDVKKQKYIEVKREREKKAAEEELIKKKRKRKAFFKKKSLEAGEAKKKKPLE